MSWAGGRRLVVLLIVGAVLLAFLTILSFTVFYTAPSCADGVENQGEAGTDCGGPCAYLCTDQAQAPAVLFTKAVSNGEGRVDVVAEIENKNATAAAKNVPYEITLYGAGQILLGKSSGVVDLPPNAVVPVFATGVVSGNQAVTGAFLEIDSAAPRWVSTPKDPRVIPTVSEPRLGGTASAPRVFAQLTNPSIVELRDVRAVVFVRDSQGEIIAASATIAPSVPALGKASLLFTWNGPFNGVPARLEVLPLLPLP